MSNFSINPFFVPGQSEINQTNPESLETEFCNLRIYPAKFASAIVQRIPAMRWETKCWEKKSTDFAVPKPD